MSSSADEIPLASSTSRILALEGVERRLVELVETAAEAVAALGNASKGASALAEFDRAATTYYSTLELIQRQLRSEFRRIREAGIGDEEVPWRAGELIAEEVDCQAWVQSTEVLGNAIKAILAKPSPPSAS